MRAVTTTGSLTAGSMGLCATSLIAGGALVTARLLRAPGVPQFGGNVMGQKRSSHLPRSRNRISGDPFNQRTLARIVAVLPDDNAETSGVRRRFTWLSPRAAART